MNVEDAWNQGFTGKGVVITLLDDGLEWTHSEIIESFDPEASTDLIGNDSDPTPSYDSLETNKQGTGAAGLIVSKPGDFSCGVGIAYDAKVGGIRILGADYSDMLEKEGLSFKPQHIDIYNVGWGPQDDGKIVDGPGPQARNAIEEGAKIGRNGKGSIYIWASGIGGKNEDNCNCDGYVSSIYTIAIGSVSSKGKFPWYSEQCSSSLAVTFSNGEKTEPSHYTAGLKGECKVKNWNYNSFIILLSLFSIFGTHLVRMK